MIAKKGDRTRQQLIDAAAAEIAEHGTRAKMSDVAARLGLTQPAIYRHFKSREEVRQAVVEEFREKLRQLVRASLIPPDAAPADLQMLTTMSVVNLMTFLENNRDAMTVAMLQAPDGDETQRELIGMIAANVRSEIDAGHFGQDVTAEFFATCLIGILIQFIRHKTPIAELKSTAEKIALILLRGIQKEIVLEEQSLNTRG